MFWDSSAVIPLFLSEARSKDLIGLLSEDTDAVVWWLTPVECHSAFQRRSREEPLLRPSFRSQAHAALGRLDAFCEEVDQISASDPVRRRAIRLLATHVLRAGDALQLAAALVWCEENPQGEQFVCLDDRLREAARVEGFDVRP